MPVIVYQHKPTGRFAARDSAGVYAWVGRATALDLWRHWTTPYRHPPDAEGVFTPLTSQDRLDLIPLGPTFPGSES